MNAGFCVDCLEEAIMLYGTPVIFNSDQVSQAPLPACCSTTASRSAWTDICSCNICISHIHVDHGRDRALDNIFVERLWRTVKYEEVYLKPHNNMPDLLMGLTQYLQFYNQERWHQALDYKTPDDVYKTATGGGAKIMDKFNGTAEKADHVLQNWDSAIQLECEQDSILN